MRRRITVTMVSVVAAALLVATTGTAVASWFGARADTEGELRRQARQIAQRLDELDRPAVLGALRAALRLQDARIVARLPAELDVDRDRLAAGQTDSGARGRLVYAVAPGPRGTYVVLTRRVGARLAGGVWFVLVAATTLSVAAVVAANLARRLTRPLRDAEHATGRIAAGDLSARVPVRAADGEELAGLARSINAMAASLERSRSVERQFLLSVSHDLRTPLTSIRGYAEALADQQAPDPRAAAEVIVGEARRLERLVQDLLELARLGARPFSMTTSTVDVARVVARTAEALRPAAEKAGVAINLDTEPAFAAADGDRLAQVVANLVENGLKYASARIDLTVRPGAVITVKDDGPGIAPEDAPHVFEPFYRSTRRPARDAGTGLGLAIARQLVGAMGGTVEAGGDGMVVRLPGTPAGQGAAGASTR